MIVGYPQHGKPKSMAIVDAFIRGSGQPYHLDTMARTALPKDAEPVFFGAVGLEHLLLQARVEERSWWYGDNAFFDRSRGTHFRFAHKAFQIDRRMPPDWKRFRDLGLEIKAWQRGSHIVVVEQSRHFMEITGADPEWAGAACTELKKHTDREIRYRGWMANKGKALKTLQEDLNGAWALVTYASAAAVEALLAGVPVFVAGQSAAEPLSSGPIENIERPLEPDGRQEWAAGLAGMQWTLAEIREGMAWRKLTELGSATA